MVLPAKGVKDGRLLIAKPTSRLVRGTVSSAQPAAKPAAIARFRAGVVMMPAVRGPRCMNDRPRPCRRRRLVCARLPGSGLGQGHPCRPPCDLRGSTLPCTPPSDSPSRLPQSGHRRQDRRAVPGGRIRRPPFPSSAARGRGRSRAGRSHHEATWWIAALSMASAAGQSSVPWPFMHGLFPFRDIASHRKTVPVLEPVLEPLVVVLWRPKGPSEFLASAGRSPTPIRRRKRKREEKRPREEKTMAPWVMRDYSYSGRRLVQGTYS